MTMAIFTQHGNEYNVMISGHSDYGRGGPDIVCSACSTLACTLMQCVLEAEEEGTVKDVTASGRSGSMLLTFTAVDTACDRINAMVETIVSGFAMLAHSYPDNVKLSAKNGGINN